MKEEKYLVSACLAGVNCRFDGVSKMNEKVKELYDRQKAILVCPEVLGGLPVPRASCEIKNGRVINKIGEDNTEEFILGAKKTLEIAKKHNIKKAILKSNSPSCGVNKIYDGTFTKRLVQGTGITAKILKENHIEVISEEDYLKCNNKI